MLLSKVEQIRVSNADSSKGNLIVEHHMQMVTLNIDDEAQS